MKKEKESHNIPKPRTTADLYENHHGFLTERHYSRSQSLEFGVKSWGISMILWRKRVVRASVLGNHRELNLFASYHRDGSGWRCGVETGLALPAVKVAFSLTEANAVDNAIGCFGFVGDCALIF
jgi:hypothetical protein